MKTSKTILALSLIATMALSCEKIEESPKSSAIVSEENASSEYAIEIDAMADEAYELSSSALKSASTNENFLTACAVITFNRTSSPKVLTIDFGTGCVGKDGKTRMGKIIVSTESFTEVNKVRTITFESYKVNNKTISGTIVKTITRLVDEKSRLAEISENINIEMPDNKGTASRVANITRLYEFNTLGIVRDNVLTTWGDVTFTRTNGNVVTKSISEDTPLVYKAICKQNVSGIVVMTYENNKTLTIDFGDGTCDKLATVNNGSTSWVITL